MQDDRLVRQATTTARRVILSCLAATAALILALGGERVHFLNLQRDAQQRVEDATAAAGDLLLQDDILTMSANLAAASGERHWIARYQAHLPMIDSAIARALRLASPRTATQYEQSVKAANDSLVVMETAAFAAIDRHDLVAARAVLTSAPYREQKDRLSKGQQRFLDSLHADVAHNVRLAERLSWRAAGALLLAATLAFGVLWRRLNIDLLKGEAAFRATQSEITRMALHDALTGLPNRRYLTEQMERAMATRDRASAEFAVLVIDLDGFKPINDRFGHPVGDQVLNEVGVRLAATVRRGELAARLGGDEFVVMLRRPDEDDGLLRAANRIIRELSRPIALDAAADVRIGASVGVALYPQDASDAEELLRRADLAMYRAKDAGRGDVRFFQESMDAEVHERAMLETDLRAAIANGQIVPYFQPLIDLDTRALTGFEILARWQHPQHGLLTPDRFISIAEDTRMIGAMTLVMLRTALHEARSWDESLSLAVNIAPQMLEDETLVDQIVSVARETGVRPSRLEVEITESAIIRDIATARRVISQLKSHGMSVALDDFGTGYSSLSHLSELSFDRIKIDRSFIQSMTERSQSATIVTAIIGLGESMQLRTTAEGIESEAHEQTLRRMGCRSGQGFLYSRPVAAYEIPDLIDQLRVSAIPVS
jgi:diguanylate cyclase (GGDEF)-like protein